MSFYGQNDIMFSPELGLAIERPPFGTTVEDLWRIIKISKWNQIVFMTNSKYMYKYMVEALTTEL